MTTDARLIIVNAGGGSAAAMDLFRPYVNALALAGFEPRKVNAGAAVLSHVIALSLAELRTVNASLVTEHSASLEKARAGGDFAGLHENMLACLEEIARFIGAEPDLNYFCGWAIIETANID